MDFRFNSLIFFTELFDSINFHKNYSFYVFLIIIILLIYFFYVINNFNDIIVDLSDTKVNKNLQKAINGSNDLPPNYPNGWIPVLESIKVQTNKIETFRAFGHQLVAFRGQRGQVYILDAFCPHLGANIGVGGRIVSEFDEDCVRCPFHGWTFRGIDGRCVRIPDINPSDVPNVKIKVWESLEVNHIIFVWYHSEGSQPFWFPKQIKPINNNEWKFEGRTEHIVNCHFQEIPENGPDRAHLNELHSPAVMSGNIIKKKIFYDLISKLILHEWESEWWADTSEPHIAHMKLMVRNKVFGFTILSIDFTVRQMGPAFVELLFKTKSGISGAFLQMVIPVEPNLNRIIHQIYCEPTLKGKLLAKFLLYGEIKMIERDIIIWNNKKFLKNPTFSKNEKNLVLFRRWFRQFYSEKDYKMGTKNDF